MKLTIYKSDNYSRKHVETEDCYLSEQPVQIGLSGWKDGLTLRFLVPDRRASWYGELSLTPEKAEQLVTEISKLLAEYEVRTIIT